MSTTTYEQLGELYIETLAQNAYYRGAAGTIVDAISSWHDVLSVIKPDQPSQRRPHQMNAAAKLTRDAMGFVERTVSWVSDDWFKGGADWARIDAYWDSATLNPDETQWVIEQLSEQGKRAWSAYRSYLPDGVLYNGGIHLNWIHDLALAATFLQSAALLLKEVEE